MQPATILIVDDDESLRRGLVNALRAPDTRVIEADSAQAALEALRVEAVDVVISDQLMPGMNGLELLGLVHDRYPDTVRIMLTGHADMRTVVKAINEGEIYRFLEKPCDRTELRVTVHLALERLELERENRRLLAIVRTRGDLVNELEEARRQRRSFTLG